MRQQLRIHPDSRSTAVTNIDVEIACSRADKLEVSYIVTGAINRIRMPAAAVNARSDGLWRHTCFETFIHASSDAGYYELNFSPSGQWAAYRFSGYRNGMQVADEIANIRIQMHVSADECMVRAALDQNGLTGLPRDHVWRLGLSAVIEDMSGDMSYWALAHPPGKPDFHHADGFACQFSPLVTP